MTKIKDIWFDLQNDSSLSAGLLFRRYSASVLPDIYIAFQKPELVKGIALRIPNDSSVNLSRYGDLRDINLAIIPAENFPTETSFLLITLVNREHEEVFETLCLDLVHGISEISDEEHMLKGFLNRFGKWKSLFDKATQEGLTSEEQRGLYGELYFLRKLLFQSSDLQHCIKSWLGPDKELRDFQSGNIAVEVKTTHGNNHQKIHISSERQLDITHLNKLFLYRLSIESQQGNGENLNLIINTIISLLSDDVLALAGFRSGLLNTGYYFHHAVRYENTGYQLRNEHFYDVKEKFPRIEEGDICAGIGDVKYSIILSDFSEYMVSESFVFDKFK